MTDMDTRANSRQGAVRALPGLAMALLAALLLSGCGGGAETTSLPNQNNNPSTPNYTGPSPQSADVQAFKSNLWDNLITRSCAQCHATQAPAFLRSDDINLAYAAANPFVNLVSPGESAMVSQVAGVHHCWLPPSPGSDQACADTIATWITAWAAGSVQGDGNEIQLSAPPIKEPGESKSFPDDPSGFAATVHPLLTAHCASCHTETAPTRQAPYFANNDPASAYEAAKQRMDLDNPANSRLVVRLREEFHNCWSQSCQNDAQAMQAAIVAFADPLEPVAVDAQLITSKALNITDGIVASGGNRHEANVIALYQFKTGTGNVAFDTSGVEPSLNLTLSGDFDWVGGWGVELRGGKAQGLTAASSKLSSLIQATGEYSIEAWVVPANVTQEGPARIVSYSGSTAARNFTLGQSLYEYEFLHRSTTTDANGEVGLSTSDEDLQATLQHVVATFDPVNGRRLYVNGVYTEDADPAAPGSLGDWDNAFALVLGSEVNSQSQWHGTFRLVAIHSRALTGEQIADNFAAGVGEKFYLLFGVSELTGVPQSYILFEVSQFDSYSYLFNRPTFVSLDPNANPSGALQAMRIGINGREAAVGQAYRHLDVSLSASGQVLSELGTIIALEKGPENDEFFLTFERLGSHVNVVTEPQPLAPPPPVAGPPVPDIGLRTFEEINASMAAVTGVSTTHEAVQETFATLRQQLPTVENIEGFLSSHQIGISQLAIEYCNALVDDATLRAGYFPGFDFAADASTAFTPGNRSLIINPLLDRIMGSGLSSQPNSIDVSDELNDLIDRLTVCAPCGADRTATVVKASCAALLGSAALLVQ